MKLIKKAQTVLTVGNKWLRGELDNQFWDDLERRLDEIDEKKKKGNKGAAPSS